MYMGPKRLESYKKVVKRLRLDRDKQNYNIKIWDEIRAALGETLEGAIEKNLSSSSDYSVRIFINVSEIGSGGPDNWAIGSFCDFLTDMLVESDYPVREVISAAQSGAVFELVINLRSVLQPKNN
jgi:hypothetical protein